MLLEIYKSVIELKCSIFKNAGYFLFYYHLYAYSFSSSRCFYYFAFIKFKSRLEDVVIERIDCWDLVLILDLIYFKFYFM